MTPPPHWRKASASGSQGCVELASLPGRVLVRDSKNPGGPRLAFSPAALAALFHSIREQP